MRQCKNPGKTKKKDKPSYLLEDVCSSMVHIYFINSTNLFQKSNRIGCISSVSIRFKIRSEFKLLTQIESSITVTNIDNSIRQHDIPSYNMKLLLIKKETINSIKLNFVKSSMLNPVKCLWYMKWSTSSSTNQIIAFDVLLATTVK